MKFTVSVGVVKLLSEESRASMNLNCPCSVTCCTYWYWLSNFTFCFFLKRGIQNILIPFFTTTSTSKSSQHPWDPDQRGTWPGTDAKQLRQGQGRGLEIKSSCLSTGGKAPSEASLSCVTQIFSHLSEMGYSYPIAELALSTGSKTP